VWTLLYIHTHTTSYATWVTLESQLHNSGAVQSFPVSFSRASFSNHLFFIHISHIFCRLSFISQSLNLNPASELPIIKTYQFWWWRKPECPDETTDTWPAPKIPFIRCNVSSAASWDQTHTPHRHWLQACNSDTSDAPWTARPPPLRLWRSQAHMRKEVGWAWG
jgi:hypothetical protein